MLALFGNFGVLELVLIGIVAVLVFGKDLPQAASKAYLQLRKLRGAVDDLRRDSGIERELRDIERSVREAEWEARRRSAAASPGGAPVARRELPATGSAPVTPPPASTEARPGPEGTPPPASSAPEADRGAPPTDAASC